MTPRRREAIVTAVGRAAQQFVVMLGWSVLYLVVVLVSMTGVIRLATGWDTVLVTGGSMSPTLTPGDVLFVDDHPDELLGQQSVITYRSVDGELVTHRVFATDAATDSYITKGDANPSPDSDLVPRDDVEGVSWLVVPYLGLPMIWLSRGDLVPLVALFTVAALAVLNVAITYRGKARRRTPVEEPLSGGAQRGILRVRFVVGLILLMLIVRGGGDESFGGSGAVTTPTLAAALVALLAISVTAMFRARRATGSAVRRLALLELGADTVVVVVFVAASGTSSIGWILMALPIIEAAIAFRLTGAFFHWIVMGGLSIAALFWSNRLANAPQSVALTNLEQLIDRLGVLLLVVIPASYLAEQLFGDVAAQRRATRVAKDRSAIIERVTDAGLDVARLGVDVFPTLANAATDLGFTSADCWAGDGQGGWRLLAAASPLDRPLPAPNDPAGTLRAVDLGETEVYVTTDDPDEAAAASLDAAGFGVMIRLTLAQRDSILVVLRVAAASLGEDPTSQVKALRLLGAQAGIALRNERLVAELQSTHAEIAHQARFDALTGLANRSHFASVFDEALAAARSDSTGLAVMFLDLNGFKAVNDRQGHHVGDELLTEVARRLTDTVGDSGLVARLGGDEFTVLLTGSASERADSLAERIHTRIDEPFHLADDRLSVHTSIGVATRHGDVDVSEMMRRADVAMYAAKSAGGARRTRHYEIALDEVERRTNLLSSSLSRALATDELHMVYQPIVVGETGEIVGFESLVRWMHPELGAIPVDELLAVAESDGHIRDFNRWVVRRSIEDIAGLGSLDATSGDGPFIAVNVSPNELELDDLSMHVRDSLETVGMPPHRLVIELSERMIVDSSDSIANIARLKELGVRLALDDFGEGHTSLTHLRRLPIDFLKLDRVFVVNANESAQDRTVLRSVVSLAHDLGFSVIAEGVETIDHLTVVSKAGAELVQGYGLYRPMPIDELAKVLGSATPTFESLSLADLEGLSEHTIEPVVHTVPNDGPADRFVTVPVGADRPSLPPRSTSGTVD